MNQTLKILAKVDCKPHVDIFEELASVLPNFAVNHEIRVVSCEKYYRTGITGELKRICSKVYEMPRPGDSETPIWREISKSDVLQNFSLIMDAFDRALHEFDPDIFILPYDVGKLEAGFIRRSTLKGTPSLIVQEGLIIRDDGKDPFLKPKKKGSVPQNTNFLHSIKRALRPYHKIKRKIQQRAFPVVKPFGLNGADYIAAIGPLYKQHLINRGISENRLSVTGLPRFDRLWRIAVANGRSSDKKNAPNGLRPKVIYLQNNGFHYGSDLIKVQSELRAIDEAARYFGKSIYLKVRLRPEENLADYTPWWSKTFNYINYMDMHEDLYDVLLGCDFVIASISTTTIIEAMLLGLPVVNYNPNRTDNYSFISSGAVLPSYDRATLIGAVQKILNGGEVLERLAEGRKRFITERILFDGQSSSRVAAFILNIKDIKEIRRADKNNRIDQYQITDKNTPKYPFLSFRRKQESIMFK
ncbi:hypothetical protein JXL19_09705 [bacterium]|nr:hypothetical protein [bacterium]